MLVSKLNQSLTALSTSSELTVTIVENNTYISSVTGIQAYKIGNKILICDCGFACKTVSAQSDFENVAKISGWSAKANVSFSFVNPNNTSQEMIVLINTSGYVRMFTASGFTATNIRGNVVVPVNFA
jgi:hypothetical protein